LEAALLASEWQFAKSMPKFPHWYTLRMKWSQSVCFEDVVQAIRDYGVEQKWGKATYTYYEFGGWQYWTTEVPLPITILINKAEIKAGAA
jgi:hypothetical protein